jgi:hypothetical protein
MGMLTLDGIHREDGLRRRAAAAGSGAPVLGRRRGEAEEVQRDVAELLVGLARLEGQRKRQIVSGGSELDTGGGELRLGPAQRR